jgi:hypothetical protein
MTLTHFFMPDTSENRPDIGTADSTWPGLGLHKSMLPKTGEPVIVQCQGFRCLGYHDSKGIWRNVRTAQELEGVKGWCGIGDDAFTPIA